MEQCHRHWHTPALGQDTFVCGLLGKKLKDKKEMNNKRRKREKGKQKTNRKKKKGKASEHK